MELKKLFDKTKTQVSCSPRMISCPPPTGGSPATLPRVSQSVNQSVKSVSQTSQSSESQFHFFNEHFCSRNQ